MHNYEGDQVTLPKRRPLSHHRHPINGSVPQKRWRNLVVVESNQESFILLKEEMTFLHPRGSVVANNQAGEHCFNGNVMDNNRQCILFLLSHIFAGGHLLADIILLHCWMHWLHNALHLPPQFLLRNTSQMSCTASFVIDPVHLRHYNGQKSVINIAAEL